MPLSFLLLFLRLSPLFLVRLSRGWTATGNRQKNKAQKPLSKLPGSISPSSWWEVFSESVGKRFSDLHSASQCSDSSEALPAKPLCYTDEREIGGCSYKHDFGFDSHTILCQTGPFRRKSCWDDLFLTVEVWGGQMTAWVHLSFCWHACALSAFIFASKGRSNYKRELDLCELQVEGSLTSR